MASCGSLQHIFEKPLSENPSNLLQSFTSWKHLQPLEVSSVTEFFGELHFKEHTEHVTPIPHSAPSSSSFSIDFFSQPKSEILSGMRSRITGGELPPPISRIGRTGKPAVSFTSYRQNGRFVLKEVKLQIQESLHACREDGRLKLVNGFGEAGNGEEIVEDEGMIKFR